MIDYIKLQPTKNNDFENHIISNKVVELKTFLDTFTGEIKEYPKLGKLLNLDVKINPVYSSLSGSLHKFQNIHFLNQDQNYNDFNYEQLSNLIPSLVNTFDLGNSSSLGYLELGFNLKVDFNPQTFVDDNLLMYDYRSHNKDLKKGDYKEFIKTDFNIKIYNKSKHFNLKEHILRIELKITKKRFLQKLDIYTLEDLLCKNKLCAIFNVLQKEFEKVIIVDNFEGLEIPIKDIEKLNKYTNPNYWNRIKKPESYKVQKRLKNDFKLILTKYNLDTIKKDLQYKLIYKFEELMNENYQDLLYSKEIA